MVLLVAQKTSFGQIAGLKRRLSPHQPFLSHHVVVSTVCQGLYDESSERAVGH